MIFRFLFLLMLVTGSFAFPVFAQAADVLCPELDESKRDAPGDVAGVQADIERLNLCVERAKLLKQLDDIASKRAETLRAVTDPMSNLTSGVSMGGSSGAIPPMPASSFPSLPSVDTNNLKSGEVRIKNAGGSPFGGSSKDTKKAEPAPIAVGWKIRKIWGQAGGVAGAIMRAQISDGRGTLLNVTKGDPLPDGNVVESVSIKGVTLSQNGKIIDLSWDESSDSASGSVSTNNDNQTTP